MIGDNLGNHGLVPILRLLSANGQKRTGIPGSQRDDLIGIGKEGNKMGSGRLSVISAYGYARHERTSAPAQANAPLVAERRVEYAQHY